MTPHLSINAMNGCSGFNTMRVSGHLGKKTIHILLDSGSIHNFLDEQLARRLGYRLESIAKQSVVIAGGRTMICQYVCRRFTCTMQGTEFVSDALLLPLGGCDLVLRV